MEDGLKNRKYHFQMTMCSKDSRSHVLVALPTLGKRQDLVTRSLHSISLADADPCVVLIAPPEAQFDNVFLPSSAHILRMPAKGISSAVNAGARFAGCSADFFTWIGDDDYFEPSGLHILLEALNGSKSSPFAAGACRYVGTEGRELRVLAPSKYSTLITKYWTTNYAQPATLLRREAFLAIGALDERLKFTMDLDLWIKLTNYGKPKVLANICANYTWHSASISQTQQSAATLEAIRVRMRHLGLIRSLPSTILGLISIVRLVTLGSSLDWEAKLRNKKFR